MAVALPARVVAARNARTGTLLGDRIRVADRMLTRLRGLLGRSEPGPDEGLMIVPCTGVHTLGMRYPIDVVFLDRDGRVVRTCDSLRPTRAVPWVRHAHVALELRAGTVARTGVRAGDLLLFEPGVDPRRATSARDVAAVAPPAAPPRRVAREAPRDEAAASAEAAASSRARAADAPAPATPPARHTSAGSAAAANRPADARAHERPLQSATALVPRAGGAATERARAKARRRRALPALAARGAGPVWLGAAVGLAAGLLAAWLLADVRALLLAGPLLVAVVTDLRERRIPNWLTLGGTVFALASAVPGVLALAALGAVVAGGAGLLLAIVARDGFGMGDVKLLAYGGAAVTLPSVPALLLATSLAGGALALAVLLERGPRRGLTMPFGPAIAAGCGWALLIR